MERNQFLLFSPQTISLFYNEVIPTATKLISHNKNGVFLFCSYPELYDRQRYYNEILLRVQRYLTGHSPAMVRSDVVHKLEHELELTFGPIITGGWGTEDFMPHFKDWSLRVCRFLIIGRLGKIVNCEAEALDVP